MLLLLIEPMTVVVVSIRNCTFQQEGGVIMLACVQQVHISGEECMRKFDEWARYSATGLPPETT